MRQLFDTWVDFFDRLTWDFRQLPYSYDHYKLMRNEHDNVLYKRALDNLINGVSESETFICESGEEITIRTYL